MAAVVQYPALRPYDLRKIGSRVAKVCSELQLCCKNIRIATFTRAGVVQSVDLTRARVRKGDGAFRAIPFRNYIILTLYGLWTMLGLLLLLLVSYLYIHFAATSGFILNQNSIWAASTSSGTMRIVLPRRWILWERTDSSLGGSTD